MRNRVLCPIAGCSIATAKLRWLRSGFDLGPVSATDTAWIGSRMNKSTALASWRDGKAKQAILDFVTGVTTESGPGFVAPADRIATFDNDGTLWVEQPLPPQFDFVFRKWGQEVKQNPALAQQQPYKAIFERDPAFLQGVATQEPAVIDSLLKAFGRSWAGTTPANFEAQVREWTVTAKQPKLGVSYLDLVYKPMLELFDLLKDNGFRIFVCSGGGRDFMRVFARKPGAFTRSTSLDPPPIIPTATARSSAARSSSAG